MGDEKEKEKPEKLDFSMQAQRVKIVNKRLQKSFLGAKPGDRPAPPVSPTPPPPPPKK